MADRHFRIAFSRCLGNLASQSQASQAQDVLSFRSESLLASVSNYLTNFRKEETVRKQSILSEAASTLEDINKRLDQKEKKYKCIELLDYGGTIILQKQRPELFTNIYLIYCPKWQMRCNVEQSEEISFNGPEPCYDIQHIGQVQNTESLTFVYNCFLLCLKKEIQIRIKNNSQRDLASLIKDCRKALQYVNQFNLSSPPNESAIQFSIARETQNSLKINFLKWSMIWGLVYFHSHQDSQLIEILIVDYKLYLLRLRCEQQLNTIKKTSHIDLKNLMAALMICYQQLRAQLQLISSQNNIYYQNEKCVKSMRQIGELIQKLDYPHQQLQFKLQEVGRHYDKPQLQINAKHLVPPLTSIVNNNQQSLKGISDDYIVSTENTFRDLLDKHDQLEIKKMKNKDNNYEDEEILWLMAVEDSLFTMAYNQLSLVKPFKKLSLSLLRMQRNGPVSQNMLTRVFRYYQKKMVRKMQKYAYNLECQVNSHIELMKAIVCIIGFEVFKRQFKNSIYDISDFRLPIDYHKFYSQFNSLSHMARKAVLSLFNYAEAHKQKQKQDFFNHTKGYNNMKIYALKVAMESASIKNEVDKKMKNLIRQKEVLRVKIQQVHEQVKEHNKKLSEIQKKLCLCPKSGQLGYHQFYLKKCQRCRQKDQIQYEISKLKNKTQKQIQTSLPENDALVHQFFYSINSQIEGLINMALICQHNDEKPVLDKRQNYDDIIVFRNGKLMIKTEYGVAEQFRLFQKTQKDVDKLVKYSKDRLKLTWNGNDAATINYKIMSYDRCSQIKQMKQSHYYPFKQFLQNPQHEPDRNRQHFVYAKIGQRPTLSRLEQFLALGSTRVGRYTQLTMCMKGLLNRSLGMDVLSGNYEFVKYIVYRSIASIQVTKPQQLLESANTHLDECSRYSFQFFMANYIEEWKNEDFNSLPLIGPILSLISRIINDQAYEDQDDQDPLICSLVFSSQPIDTSKIKPRKVIKKVVKKIKEQYERLQKDIIAHSETQSASVANRNRQNQYFVCFGGICCFTQLILNDEHDTCIDFIKLLVMMKIKQTYLGSLSREEKSKYQEIVKKYSTFKFRAIQNNIRVALKYIENNINKLTEIVQIVDESAKQDLRWQKDSDGPYVFRGTDNWENIYKIDIKTGKVIKNGQSISRVPEAFKRMTQYVKIFGNRDFEVFPSQGKQTMETKRNFVDLFLGNLKQNDTALFEFGYVNNEPTINLVFRYQDQGKSQTWRLLQSHILLQQLPIPKIYSQKYYAWYCQEISCIVFRKPNLQNIGEVALVIFLEKTPHWKKEFTHSHVISRQNYRASMDIICNPKEKNFDKLILRKNLQKQSQAYLILSRIEKVQYILELESYQNNERKFWLHRYDYMFIQNQKNGLIPQGYKNYRVSKHPFSNTKIPWKEADNISCLVLEKIIFNEATQLLHNYKILVPEWLCDQHGHINIPEAQDINETKIIYAYDIHDHYGDIRGIDRISQIHLASILAAVNKNVRDRFAKMTPLEYSMKVLKSCYNNIPLSEKQTQQIKNLLAISACQHSESLALMCYALLKCTREIDTLKKQTISFMIKIHSKRGLQPQINIQNFISMMTTKYCSKLKNRLIPLRQILPAQIARLLGIKESKTNKGKIKNWRQINKLCYRLPANAIEQFISKYKQVLQQWSKINLQIVQGSSSAEQNINKQQKVFPLDVQNPEQNILLSEVQTQLKKSYDAYRKTKDHIAGVKIRPKQLNQKFKLMLQKLTQSKIQLQKLINGVCLQNHQHIDILTAYQPILSSFDFVNFLIEGEHNISEFLLFNYIFPDFNSQEEKQQFKFFIMTLVKMWTLFCVKINSCQRILIILKHQIQDRDAQLQTDKIALFRQCQSPRAQIQDRIHWVCFQAEMKIQIWKSQFETFNALVIKNASGSVSQLNMGEGKTQVIIPMITLQLFYGKNLQDHEMFKNQQKGARKTPRVNLMESLLSQSKVNYFKFLSITAFNIPLTVLPFDRGVNFKNDICLKSIIRSLSYFKNKMVILLDQSSTHSLMLKLKEETLKRQGGVIYNKEIDIFKQINPFDIFDQVDAQLIPKKSFIYSVGKSSILDGLQLRISIAAGLIQTIQSIVEQKKQFYQFFTYDESEQDVHNSIRSGQFPKGLRLISNSLSSQDLVMSFRQFVFLNFIKIMDKNQGFEFLKTYNQKELGKIIDYVIKEQQNQNIIPQKTNEGAKKVLYIFRGYLAYGVFQHCLYLRFNVHHGVPDNERKLKKRLAVPYEAADIPSKKNDYAHPDVAILLTLLAYYSYGLNMQQSIECLDHLIRENSQNQQAKNMIYQKWHSSLSDRQRKYLKVASTSQVQLHSHTQRERLWTTFKKNRSFIYFWLQNKVFPKDMIQFEHSITSSSWDHADVQACIGFSGTKDNSRLLPTYVRLIQSENLDILGTDGKMLDLMIENVINVVQIGEGNESLWQRFLQDVLKRPKEQKIGSIIDAGALLASKSLKNHIVPWLASNQKFINLGYKGICFCNDNQWKVYKLSSHQHIDRGTSIPDSETFVVYDEYRTRGADIKMDANVVAILTLSSTITKDSLMQAVGRLRKLGRNQKLIIFMTKQVKFKIQRVCKYRDDMEIKDKVKTILEWSCLNSVAQNEKYFLPNAKLAKIHYANKQDPRKPFVDKTETNLKKMYSEKISYEFIADVCNFTLDSINQQKLLINEKVAFQKLRQISTLYGKKGKVKNLNFQAVCQRQTQIVQQTHKQINVEQVNLSPIAEIDQIKLHKASQKCFGFKFSYKLQISQNFSRCTSGYSAQIFSKKDMNQLMNVQFVWLTKDSIAMITQREAHKLLTSKCLPVYQTDHDQNNQNEFIAKISDLSINDKFIKKNKLQHAYVHCKFYNGCSIFNDSEEQKILINLLQNQNDKKLRIKFFIDKRRQSYKFKSSTLEKILRDTESMPDYVQFQADNDNPRSSSYMQLLQSTEKFRQQALKRHKQTGKGVSSTNQHGQQEKNTKLRSADQQEQQSSEEYEEEDNSEKEFESNEEQSNDG